MKSIREKLEESIPCPKSALKDYIIDVIPESPGKAVCPVHGEYTFKYAQMPFGNKCIAHSTCMKCISERNAFIDSEVARINKEEEETRIIGLIIDRGVSKRNANKVFNTFVAETDGQKKAKALYKDFALSVSNHTAVKNLIVCGSVGTGKTHLASSVINQVTRAGKTCELVKIIDLIRQFKNTWSKDNDSTEESFLRYYSNIDALIIDEVGVQFGSDTERMVIFDVIDGRYNNMLPTILISNLALDDVKELIGERAIDRLREDGGQVVAMKWESNRGK